MTQKIRAAKQDANFKKLRHQPTPKTIYNTLKAHKRQQRSNPQTPSSEILNNYFTSIGPALSSEKPNQKRECKIERTKTRAAYAVKESANIIFLLTRCSPSYTTLSKLHT